ncbi:hypothetical protein [Streptomyces sp. NPDC005281]|uniref:hypothetical protein n=1 Tax=Streptomyces sp. NPDC005281 TaxID=3155712 RepID=UPI0033AC8428
MLSQRGERATGNLVGCADSVDRDEEKKQRRQLAVVDTVDKAEAKVRKAEVEVAVAVAEAVQVFGGIQEASEGLDMPIQTVQRFLRMAQDEAASAANVVESVGGS